MNGHLPLSHSCNYEVLELWLESRSAGDKDCDPGPQLHAACTSHRACASGEQGLRLDHH